MYSFWATTAVIFSTYVKLASSSPILPRSVHELALSPRAPPARKDIPLSTQAAAMPTIHDPGHVEVKSDPSYHLRPVAEIFKMVADAHSSASPVVAHPVSAPTPIIAAAKTTTPALPESPYQPESTYYAPGLVVPSSAAIAAPEADPPVESYVPLGSQLTLPAVPQTTLPPGPQATLPPGSQDTLPPGSQDTLPPGSQDTLPPGSQDTLPPGPQDTLPPGSQTTPTNTGPERNTSTGRKLIVVGGFLAGLVILLFLVYVFFDRHILSCCRRKKEEPETRTKIESPPPPISSFNDGEKDVDVVHAPSWMQHSASSYSQGSHGPSAETKARSFEHVPSSESVVLDISGDYPRSKFSVCSSEYPTSVASSTRTSGSIVAHANANRSALLPAYEFFCLSSSAESMEDNHHLRAHSAPIFGHDVTGDVPGVMVRSGEHRRSRSVSGLTYAVKPSEQRESVTSANDWTGSTQASGWPSAL